MKIIVFDVILFTPKMVVVYLQGIHDPMGNNRKC